jgi:hypothetical protein
MSQNEGRSGSSQRRLVEDDDGLDVAIAAPRRSTGDTPISRRASPLISPRLTRDPTSREGTPGRVSFESLSSRPRSNVRTRTPMRAESPLNANAFRRVSPEASSREGQRVSVRPLAGATVGAVLQTQRVSSSVNCEGLRCNLGRGTMLNIFHWFFAFMSGNRGDSLRPTIVCSG